MNHCREASSLLEPYADGELSPDKIIEVEQHLEGCERCRARVGLDAAFKRSVQKTVREAAPVTPAFMARLGCSMMVRGHEKVDAGFKTMYGEVASLLLSRVTVPVLYFITHHRREIRPAVVPSAAGALP